MVRHNAMKLARALDAVVGLGWSTAPSS